VGRTGEKEIGVFYYWSEIRDSLTLGNCKCKTRGHRGNDGIGTKNGETAQQGGGVCGKIGTKEDGKGSPAENEGRKEVTCTRERARKKEEVAAPAVNG